MYGNTWHKNGEVTYWSVYQQRWIRCHVSRVPDREVAAWNDRERARLARLEAGQ